MSDRPNFMAMLRSRQIEGKLVCVGLDSDYSKFPAHLQCDEVPENNVFTFNRGIVEETAMHVCAFKPNIAFYPEKFRPTLAKTIKLINTYMPGVPVILDSKRGDIGNTNAGYITEAFEEFGADAVTVSPYFGEEALKPFLDQGDKGIIILCRTSNPGAAEFQNQRIFFDSIAEIRDLTAHLGTLPTKEDGSLEWEEPGQCGWFIPLYQLVALRVARYWNKNKNCALVVGATAPHELKIVRYLVGDMPILVPGIGAQGGNLKEVLKAGLTPNGDGLVINASRSVIFASNGSDYADAARQEVLRMNTEIQKLR